MFKGQTLRVLVNDRLASAAEDILLLFERTIAEYEEELSRFKNQHLFLNKVVRPKIELHRGDFHIQSRSPVPGLNQEIIETLQMKEEQKPHVHEFVKMMNERLAAAAEEIFLLFERTVTQYKEELSCSKEENQIKVATENFQIPSTSPGPGLNQGITVTPEVKEEPGEQSCVKQEEEQLSVSVPGFIVVRVKAEESSLQHSSDTDNDDDWEPSGCSQMETEADGDHSNQVQSRDTELSSLNTSAPENMVYNQHMSEADWERHQHPFRTETFTTESNFKKDFQIHTREKSFSCLICEKTFAQKGHLIQHNFTHTGEKPYMCLVCGETFAQKGHLDQHNRRHTGEKPYSCSVCEKTFTRKGILERHSLTHKGKKPYSCAVCEKTFVRKDVLERHSRIHKGEKPYSCSICEKTFSQKTHLVQHVRTHTGEKPYCCSVCEKTFCQKSDLKIHNRIHTGEKPYSCTVCARAFSAKFYLRSHMKIHREPSSTES